jgi:peroxiredoxin
MAKLLTVGQPLPELDLFTTDGAATTLRAHLSPQNTLVFFLHGTWCPECVGQLHILQRYRAKINAVGADIVVVTSEEKDGLAAFLTSAVPPLEYTVLADPQRSTYSKIGVGGDTVAVIVDGQGLIRWTARWLDHREEPGYETILRTLREVSHV